MEKSVGKTLPKRENIEKKYKWKLEDIYPKNSDWEKDFAVSKEYMSEIINFKGKLADSPKKLLKCLTLYSKLMSLTDRVFVYARMKKDEDNSNSLYQGLAGRAYTLMTDVLSSVSFIVPEIIALPENVLNDFISKEKELKIYQQFFNELLRQKEHILSEKEEKLLALSSEMAGSSREIFSMFNNADIRFPNITNENNEEIELTKGNYIKFLESENRRVREDAFNALYTTYGKFKNTLAASLLGSIKAAKFYASTSKYNSSLEASLDSDNITPDVYNNLIDTIDKNLPLLHRYLRLRKKALGLEHLHMYDLYVPMVEKSKMNIPYEEAKDIVKDSLKPLGSEYLSYLDEGFKNGWIDVYENRGKTSGAYSWGTYTTHPYVLLNYQGTINDVFTLAHEMGHAIHSFFTNKAQPYIYSEYKIFVAEVASTVNESLLIKHLLEKTHDPKEKAYLLNHYLEQFRGTVFRQVMFAEFEKIMHEKYNNKEALTTETLCHVYLELNKKYFEKEVEVDKGISIEWARIPHFYSSFYVYKYATGFSAATAISNMILHEGQSAVDRYINFLKGGSSDYPLELLKTAGVDLSTPQPIQDALKIFEETLSKLEELIG